MDHQTVGIRLIGQALLEQRLLNEEQLNRIHLAQPKQKQRLGEAAVSLGFMSEPELAKFLAVFFDLPHAEIADDEELDFAAVELVPEALARRYCVIVTRKEGEVLTVAMADPLDVRAIDALRLETRCRIRKIVSSRSSITRAIDRAYHAASRLATLWASVMPPNPEPSGASIASSASFSRG
jgi:type IV pilus assembly protein PilB